MSVNADPPPIAFLGDNETSCAGGFVPGVTTTKKSVFDKPPPGPGVKTMTGNVAAAMMSAAATNVCNWLLLTNVVVRSVPFQRTTDVGRKPVPVIVNVKPAAPAATNAVPSGCAIKLIAGAGLLIVRIIALERPPPGAGLNTSIWAVPAVAMSAAAMTVCNEKLETKVVT